MSNLIFTDPSDRDRTLSTVNEMRKTGKLVEALLEQAPKMPVLLKSLPPCRRS